MRTRKEKIKMMVVVIFCSFIFSGCWDKFEPEERGFVTAMGIDKTKDSKFNICVEVPALNIFEEKGGKDGGDEEENENSYVESYSDSTIWSAVKAIDSKTDRKLDFGQIKLCVLGEDILKDREMTKQAIDAIERNKDIWRKVIVCFTKGKAEDILKGYVGDRKTAGFFTDAFFNNNRKSTDFTFKKTLQDVLSDLSGVGETILPIMEVKDGEIEFNGMAVIKDYRLEGYCGPNIIKGYNIIKEDIMETDIVTSFNGVNVPLKINKKNTDIKFKEENGKVKCVINVEIEGDVEEYRDGKVPVSELEKSYQDIVSKHIRSSFDFFRDELEVDVLRLGEYCRKKDNDLYKKFGEENVFKDMELSENISVIIKGTGTIN
ncbi:MAG: Ger(x)C family spore germination protein [Clostridiales bacterium]|nr:Ger(x)C family spore germination protein [Clostridiales bacterium]